MVKINITLKFIGTGYNDYYQAFVEIYDKKNMLIYSGYSYNGIIKIFLKKDVYKIKIRLGNIYLITVFYANNQNEFIFNINRVVKERLITFLLTDYNYNNLPIMKGEILLGKDS